MPPPLANVAVSFLARYLPFSCALLGLSLLTVRVAGAQAPTPSAGPSVVLTLDEALRMAEERSEQVAIAAAGIDRAKGGEGRARSEKLPQLAGSASYDRALKSEFSGLFDANPGPACEPLQANPSAPLADRVAELERAYDCLPSGGLFGSSGGNDVQLPFGRANTYRINLQFSQTLFSGGRIEAQQNQARLATASATTALGSARAQLALDVAQAYLDAALSDRLVTIAEATFDQADRAFQQTQAQRQAGRQSEFDLLRAQVARDTLQPDVIRRRATRDIAYLRLKQLLELPAEADLRLEAPFDRDAPPAQRFATAIAQAEAGMANSPRAGVVQAENDVRSTQAALTIAHAQRLPTVAVNSAYGLVAYPSTFPAPGDFRTNWTVGATVQLPILTGGRIRADETIARADIVQAQQRLALTRELAQLDEWSARQELKAARATWDASASTVQQAQRAYEIAELRYREGLSTQLELSDSRLLLQQAEVNRAQAARDLHVARIRLALLPELPLSAAGTGSTSSSAATGAARATSAAFTQSGAQQR